MESMECEASLTNERIKQFEKIPVIKNYYLVLGGGKIGTDFLEYARKNKFPFVLVIDRDENAPASRESDIIKTEDELVNLLKDKALASLSAEVPESPRATVENRIGNRGGESKTYFYKMDLDNIPFLLSLGIPEYIIPAIPCHAIAYMLADLLKLPPESGKEENPEKVLKKARWKIAR